MCDPVSITLGAISVGTSAASALANHKAQNQAAKAQNSADAQRYGQTVTAANASAAFQNKQLDAQSQQTELAAEQQVAQIALRRQQETQGARISIMDASRSAQLGDATARLSAGASGVAGSSVTAQLTDIQRQKGDANVAINRNLKMVDQQLNTQQSIVGQNAAIAQQNIALAREGVNVDRQNRIAGATPVGTAPGGNPWLTGLQIVGAGVDAFTTYRQQSKKV